MRMEHSAKMKVIWKVFHVLLLSVKYTARLVKSDSQMKHSFAQHSFLANEKKKIQHDQWSQKIPKWTTEPVLINESKSYSTSPISMLIILLKQLFLVNQTHVKWSEEFFMNLFFF